MTASAALSAEAVARAMTAAARALGVDPLRVFDRCRGKARHANGTSPYGARVLAAATVRARLGLTRTRVAIVCKVHAQDLSPANLKKRAITTDHLLEVSEAMELMARGPRP